MKEYLIDDVPAELHDIIELAKKYGYEGMYGFYYYSRAVQILRDNGHTVEKNKNLKDENTKISESKACSFCKSKDVETEIDGNVSWLECKHCKASGPVTMLIYSKQNLNAELETIARDKWDNRPIEDELRERAEKAEARISKAVEMLELAQGDWYYVIWMQRPEWADKMREVIDMLLSTPQDATHEKESEK